MLALVFLVAIAGWQLFPSNETSSVSIRESVRNFTESDKPLDTRGVPLPPSGVYRYETKGEDRAEAVLDATNSLDGTSTVTVARSDCGIDERWDALKERWGEFRYCVDGLRWRLVFATQVHSFFGRDERRDFRCTGPAVLRPPIARAGFAWTDRCRSDHGRLTVAGKVVGSEPISVANKPIEAVHARLRGRLAGETTGAITIESWYSRENGLLLRRKQNSDTTVQSTPVGEASNRERYVMRLLSTKPSR